MGGNRGRKPRVNRSPEEKWQIVQEGMKSGNVSETCRSYGTAQTLYSLSKDEAKQGAKAAAWGRSAAAAGLASTILNVLTSAGSSNRKRSIPTGNRLKTSGYKPTTV